MKKILILFVFIILGCSQEPQTIEELRTAGQKAYIDGNYALAQKYLHKVLLLKSSDRDALYYLGQSFQKVNQDDSAVYYFKRADLLYPNDRELNLAIYSSAKIINDYKNSIKAIKVLIKTGDSPDKFLFELANLNLKAGNIFVSFLHLRKLFEKGTDDPNMYLVLGNVAAQVDSVEFAVKLMREAIKRFGEREQFAMNLAIYLAGDEKLDEAEKVLKKLLLKTPNSQALLFNLANILSLNDSKSKKQEGLELYYKLRIEYGNIFNIDSIIIDLQSNIN